MLSADIIGFTVSTNNRADLITDVIASGLDVGSSCFVVYRFALPDALKVTTENVTFERRTAIILAMSMILLAGVNVGFACIHVVSSSRPTRQSFGIQDVVALPAAVIYTIIGMLQLQMGWALRLESLVADATISLVGATISLSLVLATIVNLLAGQNPKSSFQNCVRSELGPQTYPYYYLEDVFSITLSIVLFAFGFLALTRKPEGPAWYTYNFWMKLHPLDHEVKNEASPLYAT